MILRLMPEAEEILFEVGMWVESKNTPGSGSRFINAFIDKVAAYAVPSSQYSICKNKQLASYKLCCISIDDWVVAFKKE